MYLMVGGTVRQRHNHVKMPSSCQHVRKRTSHHFPEQLNFLHVWVTVYNCVWLCVTIWLCMAVGVTVCDAVWLCVWLYVTMRGLWVWLCIACVGWLCVWLCVAVCDCGCGRVWWCMWLCVAMCGCMYDYVTMCGLCVVVCGVGVVVMCVIVYLCVTLGVAMGVAAGAAVYGCVWLWVWLCAAVCGCVWLRVWLCMGVRSCGYGCVCLCVWYRTVRGRVCGCVWVCVLWGCAHMCVFRAHSGLDSRPGTEALSPTSSFLGDYSLTGCWSSDLKARLAPRLPLPTDSQLRNALVASIPLWKGGWSLSLSNSGEMWRYLCLWEVLLQRPLGWVWIAGSIWPLP